MAPLLANKNLSVTSSNYLKCIIAKSFFQIPSGWEDVFPLSQSE